MSETTETIQHKLQQFDPGIVWLDARNVITGMNQVAAEVLGNRTGQLIGEEVLSIHPERSREKVKFLLDQAACPMDSPPPVAMMINIPERVLLIKVSRMFGQGQSVGTCMIFYDVTESASAPVAAEGGSTEEQPAFTLLKLPVYKNQQILLIDLADIVCIRAEGHYTSLYTEDDTYLCNLSVSDLESKIRLPHFVRVHRSHMVNMQFAIAFEKVDDQCWLVVDHGEDGLRVPISRPNVAKLKAMLGLK
jgi:PAS domain S-box-containing protein